MQISAMNSFAESSDNLHMLPKPLKVGCQHCQRSAALSQFPRTFWLLLYRPPWAPLGPLEHPPPIAKGRIALVTFNVQPINLLFVEFEVRVK